MKKAPKSRRDRFYYWGVAAVGCAFSLIAILGLMGCTSSNEAASAAVSECTPQNCLSPSQVEAWPDVESSVLDCGCQISYFGALGPYTPSDANLFKYSAILQYGDTGLGTTEDTGEVLIIDGEAYLVDATTGELGPLSEDETTPAAVVGTFTEEGSLTLDEALSCDDLWPRLEEDLDLLYYPTLISVTASFSQITVAKAGGPGATGSDVASYDDVAGTILIGWTPTTFDSLSGPADLFHPHFATEDLTLGGHVQSCEIEEGTTLVQWRTYPRLNVFAPPYEVTD